MAGGWLHFKFWLFCLYLFFSQHHPVTNSASSDERHDHCCGQQISPHTNLASVNAQTQASHQYTPKHQPFISKHPNTYQSIKSVRRSSSIASQLLTMWLIALFIPLSHCQGQHPGLYRKTSTDNCVSFEVWSELRSTLWSSDQSFTFVFIKVAYSCFVIVSFQQRLCYLQKVETLFHSSDEGWKRWSAIRCVSVFVPTLTE